MDVGAGGVNIKNYRLMIPARPRRPPPCGVWRVLVMVLVMLSGALWAWRTLETCSSRRRPQVSAIGMCRFDRAQKRCPNSTLWTSSRPRALSRPQDGRRTGATGQSACLWLWVTMGGQWIVLPQKGNGLVVEERESPRSI